MTDPHSILIVDDQIDNQRSLVNLLKLEYHVLATGEAVAAIRLLCRTGATFNIMAHRAGVGAVMRPVLRAPNVRRCPWESTDASRP